MGAILVRFGLYLDLMMLFGLACFGLYALRGGERRFGATIRFAPLLAGTALLGALLSVFGLVSMATGMAGVPLTAVDRTSVDLVLWGTEAGTAWQVRTTALVTAALLAFAGIRYPRFALCAIALAGAVAITTLAWSGHGAADAGALGWVHLIADVFHLLSAGIWIGALMGLALLVFRRAALTDGTHLTLSHRALAGFSLIGSVVVAVIIISGLINSWILVGVANLSMLPTTLYGQLLIAKLALFVSMLGLAGANRFHLTPAFEGAIADGDHGRAIGALRKSLAIETGCAIVILGLVAWLGTLEPPASLTG
jgi:putative copper resistance protein D